MEEECKKIYVQDAIEIMSVVRKGISSLRSFLLAEQEHYVYEKYVKETRQED